MSASDVMWITSEIVACDWCRETPVLPSKLGIRDFWEPTLSQIEGITLGDRSPASYFWLARHSILRRGVGGSRSVMAALPLDFAAALAIGIEADGRDRPRE
jgi:hypothetical protein